MSIDKRVVTGILCASLLGLALQSLATEAPDTGNYAAKIKQEESIVVRIDQNNVTLQAIGDKDKKITAPFSNAAEFKVGDKVIISGNTLKKSDGDIPENGQQPGNSAPVTSSPPSANKL